jgi:hypothetical protein
MLNLRSAPVPLADIFVDFSVIFPAKSFLIFCLAKCGSLRLSSKLIYYLLRLRSPAMSILDETEFLNHRKRADPKLTHAGWYVQSFDR